MTDASPTLTYSAESSLRRPREFLRAMFRDLSASRELAWQLTVRDITAQYRQTAMGIAWAFVMPLANTMIWLLLHSSGIIKGGNTEISYGAYVFSGIMLWQIFAEAVVSPLQQCKASKGVLTKINFPREALIIAAVYKTLINANIKVAILLVALAIVGIAPPLLPPLFVVGVLALVLTGTVLGLLLTPIGLLFNDVSKALPLLLQLLMFLSPVIYAVPPSGWAEKIVEANPMTPLIVTTRDWLVGSTADYLPAFIGVTLGMLPLLLLAWMLYRASMPIVIERLGT